MIAEVNFIIIVLLILLIYFYTRNKNVKSGIKDLKEIPHPDALPIIGNTTQVFWSLDNLWKTARKRALDHYPIYRLKIFNNSLVYLLHPEDIEIILGGTTGSIKGTYYDPLRKLTGNGLAVNNGKSWYSRRKILTKSFYFSILRKYISIFNKETAALVSRLQENLNEPADVCFHIENMTFKLSNATTLGSESTLSDKEARDYIDAKNTVTEMMLLKSAKPHLRLLWPLMKLKEEEETSLKKMDAFISKAIQENFKLNSRGNRESVVSLLQEHAHVFDNKAVRNEIDTFIFGAQDTISSALALIMMVLANYPQHQDSVYEEIRRTLNENQSPTYSDLASMDYLDRFIKECLRIYPPFILMERTLTKEVVTKTGYRLPKGTVVMISLLDIHRNPNLFPDPEKFDPDRFLVDNVVRRHPFSYLPFGAGSRNCIAKKFAMLALKSSVCGILQNYKLEPGTKAENIKFSHDAVLHVTGGIKVKLTKR